ncbi:MFS transporter [Actinophytocola algeriensis]|uniref:MFS family permease n=1 Tax=Actinophytocola algeriensis TaxID=1768010 RepID=A0A7W7Q225_9PSEU|nr:MFS transporter [Actinophytocola algeriensis]MBB4905388.1 MFS family permease [Actinophytocola algeriensis]MBE1472927.1 MFS family permease [Actinophytocola algeriensis]
MEKMSGRARAVLFVLCGSIFLEGVDVSMLGMALPAIRADLGMSTAALQWVVSAYVLGYGGFMLLGGRAADLLGRRRMFVFWLAVFLAFSGLGGFATDGWVLILARFVTGFAAAFMTPAGLSLITTTFPEGPQRNQALLWYAGTAAGGFSLGLVVGGLLTALGWRWVFFAPVLLAALILVMAIRLVPADVPVAGPRRFDVAGALSLTTGMVVLVYTVVRVPEVPVRASAVTGALSVLLLVTFVLVERRSSAPLVRLGILRHTALVRANVATVLFAGAFVSFQFITVLYLQEVRGWSAIETGLALLVVAIDAVLAPTVTPKLVERWGNPPVIVAGVAAAVVGYALFLSIPADASYWSAMFPTMVLLGLAFTLVYGPLTIIATDGVADAEQGLASGLWNTSFQFGAAIGLAVATSLSVAAHGLPGLHDAFVVPVAAAALALVVTATGLRRRPAAVPAPV